MTTPQPLEIRNLAWLCTKLGITYSIATEISWGSTFYCIQTSRPIQYNQDGKGWVRFNSARVLTPRQAQLDMCALLGWLYYNPGVSYGKLCKTSTGVMPWDKTRTVDLRWTKLIP